MEGEVCLGMTPQVRFILLDLEIKLLCRANLVSREIKEDVEAVY